MPKALLTPKQYAYLKNLKRRHRLQVPGVNTAHLYRRELIGLDDYGKTTITEYGRYILREHENGKTW